MQNSNYQNCLPQKRECVSFSKYKVFTDFQQNQNKIITQYQKSSRELMLQSLQIITAKIFGNSSQTLLQKKPLQAINQPNRIQQLHQKIFQKISEVQNKKEVFSFSMKKKDVIEYDKKSPQRQSKGAKNHSKLINQLSRLSVDEKFYDQNQAYGNDRDTNETDLLKFDEDLLKNKTITQLLQESNIKTQNHKNLMEPIKQSSSQQEYQMTDYSSNQSSNDDKHYDQVYMFEDQIKPLFGSMFANKSHSQSNEHSNNSYSTKFQFPNKKQLNFNSKQLLQSPKKTKSQRKKRLFIRQKKIPKWAEDLNEVSTIVKQQRKEINPKNIYGHFVVQNLQTNSIFNVNEDYKRTSSAKWVKTKNGYVN